jgi:hypothetical protein
MSEIIYGGGIPVKRKDKINDKFSDSHPISGWVQALSDARRRLSECQGQARQLRIAIGVIEKKISEGEAWPENSATQN